jgi:hypothetical protein
VSLVALPSPSTLYLHFVLDSLDAREGIPYVAMGLGDLIGQVSVVGRCGREEGRKGGHAMVGP